MKKELWMNYKDSKYETYINRKINTSLPNNPFNEIIQHFNDPEFAFK